MKISIKRLEKNLGYKIRRNLFVLAVDTATASGIAMLKIDSKNIDIETLVIKLPAVSKDLTDKSEVYEEKLSSCLKLIREFKEKYNITKIEQINSVLVLENSFLKMNVVTFGFLRALQGIFYAELTDCFKETQIIFPVTARNLVGFHSVLPRGTKSKDKKKEIIIWINKVLDSHIGNDNEADAVLLALASVKE